MDLKIDSHKYYGTNPFSLQSFPSNPTMGLLENPQVQKLYQIAYPVKKNKRISVMVRRIHACIELQRLKIYYYLLDEFERGRESK